MDQTLKVTTPSDREVVMTRVFNAPRNLVFDALTRPDLLKRWYGPVGWSLVACEIDLRVGGGWRFVTRRPDGREIGQRGVYREIVPPERLVNTESWEDWNPARCWSAPSWSSRTVGPRSRAPCSFRRRRSATLS
jgi:uncharacterized protein YndB with AHSA1/START domain